MEWGSYTYITVPEEGRRPFRWRDFPDLVNMYNDHVLLLSRLNLSGGRMSGPTVIKHRDNPNPEQFNSDAVSYIDSRIAVDDYFTRQYGKYFSIWADD